MKMYSRELRALRRLRLTLPVLAIALAGLVAGCGGTEGGMSSEAAPVAAQGGRERPEKIAADSASSRAADSDSDGSGSAGDATLAPQDRAIIYTAQMTVRAADVTAAADKAKQITTAAGGHVAEESTSASSGGARSTLTLKVPVDHYQDVLTRLGRDLGERRSLHQGAQDVTAQVADVDSRVKSAKATLDQFRTLLTKADKIGEVLEVEREISTREADLEALQARQRALSAQTSMATITLTLVEPPEAAKKPKEGPDGFIGGLAQGWHALTSSARVGLIVLGVLLPWLGLAAVVWVLVRLGMRLPLIPRRAAKPTPPRSPNPPSGPPAPSDPAPAGTAPPPTK